MCFRCATMNDFQRIANVLSMKEISYITLNHLLDDIKRNECFVLEDGYEIKVIGSLVYCSEYSNYAIKRVCVLHPEDCGQGYARKLINFLVMNRPCNVPLVCTPWLDNIAMQKILVGLHFHLEYVFNEKWCLYQLVKTTLIFAHEHYILQKHKKIAALPLKNFMFFTPFDPITC